MTVDGLPPHDLGAEASILGAMLMSPDAAALGVAALRAEDFYSPAHGHIFDAVETLRSSGRAVDNVTVVDHLRTHGLLDTIGGPGTIVGLASGTPSISGAERYAEIVAEHAARRSFIRLFDDLSRAAMNLDDPGDLADRATAGLASIEPPGSAPEGLVTVDEFLETEDVTGASDWIIPGLLRRSWRIIVVAGEGAGKTTMLRQIGMAAAAGVHPFLHREIPPVRVLTVDCENPPEAVDHACRPMRETARRLGDYDPTRHWLLHRQGGINLRSRRDRAMIESALASTLPDLVIIGPLYKTFRQTTAEGWELPAKEVADVFDDLRTRYGFALLIEAHAPHGEAKNRELRPEGSALWMKWPEIGLALTPVISRPAGFDVERFRGDRLPNEWPTQLDRSLERWPWAGSWGEGLPSPPAGPIDDEPMF